MSNLFNIRPGTIDYKDETYVDCTVDDSKPTITIDEGCPTNNGINGQLIQDLYPDSKYPGLWSNNYIPAKCTYNSDEKQGEISFCKNTITQSDVVYNTTCSSSKNLTNYWQYGCPVEKVFYTANSDYSSSKSCTYNTDSNEGKILYCDTMPKFNVTYSS